MTRSPCDRTDQLVTTAMDEGSIPGLALAVVQNGDLLEARSYGFANLEHKVPATTRTVFKIASITKTFTATVVMMLVEEGAVSLDDPIRAFFPHLPDTWREISVRRLLTHTSGLVTYSRVFPPQWQPDHTWEKIVRRVSELPLEFRPGTRWGYCNTNYIVLGLLIEQIGGRPYRDFVRERIFAPLSMDDTRFNDPGEIVPNRAQGYAWEGETLSDPGHPPLRNRENPTPGLWDYADGGILSTVLDLARWDAVLCTGDVLARATLEQMWTPARLNDGTPVEYGFGWIVKDVHGRRTIGHWGRVPGFLAEMSHFVDDELTVIVLCNRWKADLAKLVHRIAVLLLSEKRNPGRATRIPEAEEHL